MSQLDLDDYRKRHRLDVKVRLMDTAGRATRARESGDWQLAETWQEQADEARAELSAIVEEEETA